MWGWNGAKAKSSPRELWNKIRHFLLNGPLDSIQGLRDLAPCLCQCPGMGTQGQFPCSPSGMSPIHLPRGSNTPC